VISCIGFGGGVVAMVHPIHAPIANIATNAKNTGIAIGQNATLQFSMGFPKLNRPTVYSMSIIKQIANIILPIAWSLLNCFHSMIGLAGGLRYYEIFWYMSHVSEWKEHRRDIIYGM
jgi:hypothetical protein